MGTLLPLGARRRSLRGFTLIELLAVIAMIGVLAAIATVGYQRYINASRTGDAKAIISAIRISQESIKSETGSYLDASQGMITRWYPAAPNGMKRHWIQMGHTDFGRWEQLNVPTDSTTIYGFACVAGLPPATPPSITGTVVSGPTWAATVEPWFIIQAAGDADDDSMSCATTTECSYLLSSSFNGEIYVENEHE